ncbi:OsmC family protein [uncultured Sphaerochaeta sp.]|uniref:OsmC family protein n=1 Tax=uncultured Sphaerochaeta sp. TaxID=886478 RepID=UPI002A0A89D5|nr:OsmC family protein [uncultured Sphaerochaeta sp.]
MSEKKHIRADFVHGHYQFNTDKGAVYEIGETAPYDYLLGALSGCLFVTFEALAVKMQVAWEHISFEVNGIKRETPPTTLKDCTITATVTGCDDHPKCLKAFETATRYCSVYQTISQVAEMHWTVNFSQEQ